MTKVCFVAAPLMARSGVYRTTHDLVQEARTRGLDWGGVIGMRGTANGNATLTDGVSEHEIIGHGSRTVPEIRKLLAQSARFREADVVVTLISQSDIAVARMRRQHAGSWVAYVRGLPWPARGEQNWIRSTVIRRLEARALRRADEVWATTDVLAEEVARVRSPELVPAGIPATPRLSHGDNSDAPLVWAGRIDVDKRPEAFVALVASTGLRGRLFGEGPLRERLESNSGPGLEWAGWASPDSLWQDASIFVGTSYREAFGRSAVEAAAAGLPIIVGSEYGAAPLLFTDPELRALCVLPITDEKAWGTSVQRIVADLDLRKRISDHVYENSKSLTIGASVDAIMNRISALLNVPSRGTDADV